MSDFAEIPPTLWEQLGLMEIKQLVPDEDLSAKYEYDRTAA